MSDSGIIPFLYRIGCLVHTADGPREAAHSIMQIIAECIPCHGYALTLLNPDSQMLELEVGAGQWQGGGDAVLRLGQGITGWVALHGKPLLTKNIQEDSRFSLNDPAVFCEMAVPLIGDGGMPMGAITLDGDRVGAFSEAQMRMLQSLADEASRVIRRIWLTDQLRHKSRQLEALVQTGRSLVKKRELQELLGSITSEALSIMHCKVCAVFLLDPTKQVLSLQALSGSQRFTDYEERLALEDSAIGTAISRRKTIEVYDLQRTEEYHFQPVIRNEQLVSMLACPILYEDETIGVLTAYTDQPHRFYNEERRILETLASLGAIAIQNARLYTRIFQTEENLRKTERLTTLGLLSAEIAHEIRNPLTVIRLLFESLDLQFAAGDMRQRDVAIIGEKIDQLEAIVTRVLNFGKSREDLRSRYDLAGLVDDTLHLVRLKLWQSRIKVSFKSPQGVSLMVDVNKGQIQQALLNLIINATQAMPNGGAITVSLSTLEVDQVPCVAVDIEDSGAGVPDAIKDQIFDSFLSGHAQGTGLGLAIVKRILKSHNGDIELVASGDDGTHMRFWLPIRSPDKTGNAEPQ